MTEYWKYFNDYKFYSEDFKLIKELKKIKGTQEGATYFKNGIKVAEDVIIPKNRLEFAKRICKIS